MAVKRIGDVFNISKRFLRSVHLERDFQDPKALAGYVTTEFVAECRDRVRDGLRPESGRRAWRITGDYGSGKSSFALLIANELAGRDSGLSPQLVRVSSRKSAPSELPRLLPVLVTCSRQSLGRSILQGLQHALSFVYRQGGHSNAGKAIEEILAVPVDPKDDDIIKAILDARNRVIADRKSGGLLIVVDELGKYLEYAAQNPTSQDVFLLQQLAEAASRSGDSPLFLVCLLHQGFNAYADQLNQSAQREWEKVAGRFEEIVFSQPVEQIGSLIASALNVRIAEIPRRNSDVLHSAMQKAISLGWFGSAPKPPLLGLAKHLYPLHPTVLPVLIRAFRRFGQNERSLFSFLLSNEPFGLQAFSENVLENGQLYRLCDLFDYFRSNFGHKLAATSYRVRWSLIDSVVESYATEEPVELEILKTVAILNLLNDDLLATEELIVCAVSGNRTQLEQSVKQGLHSLRRVKRALYDRGRSQGLCLWPHSSVDLEKAYDDARRAIPVPLRIATALQPYLKTRPLVARRHYIETGNLRYFEVHYCTVSDLATLKPEDQDSSDGVIVVPLCESNAEQKIAREFAKNPALCDRPNWLIAIPQTLDNLRNLLQELQRWDWVSTNTLELNADKYAREEVSRQRQNAREQLEHRIDLLLGFKQFAEKSSLEWFRGGAPMKVRDGRHFLSELSRICDETFPDAPRIHNELVNRRTLSSAAAAARMRLIEYMFVSGSSEWLGMNPAKKPPEMSMYLSVLRNTGIHRENGPSWTIGEPEANRDQDCNVLPALKRITELVAREPDGRVKISRLFEELRRPPYGVRDGLLPLFLTVFAIANAKDIAFYKDGTFLREMTGEHMLVLTKQPDRFEVQYCKIEGVRADLFEKLLAVLELKPSVERATELLDVVQPLCVFVARLPSYVHNTKRLSGSAVAVRDAILGAREPSTLLFTELPRACGREPFRPDAVNTEQVRLFVRDLKMALDELRMAFPEQQERLRKLLRSAFDMPGSFQQFRSSLALRAQEVVIGVNETKLRAFCLRLMDDNLQESDWLESLGSFLALKPPAKWHDAEEDLFIQELGPLAQRFNRVESIQFTAGKAAKKSTGIRLAITQANGNEHEQVIHFAPEEESRLSELQGQFEQLLSQNKRLGLAAASRAIWSRLEGTEKVTR